MKVLRNPLFYVSIVLSGALAFQVVQFVRGQTTGTWQPPTAAPPGGQPEAPLDTGTSNQEKKGDLDILGSFTVQGTHGLKVGIDPDGTNRFVQILSNNQQIDFKDNANTAWIKLINGELWARHANEPGPFKLGSGGGGGGGGGLWQTSAGGNIYLTSGLVGIGTNDPQTKLHLNASRNEVGLTLEYKDTNFPAGGAIFFRNTERNTVTWKTGVYPASYTGTAGGNRVSLPLRNAWYLQQFGNRYNTSAQDYRLIIPDTGAVTLLTPTFSVPGLASLNRGGLAIQNKYGWTDGLLFFNEDDNAKGYIWLEGNKLSLAVNNTAQTFSIEPDGKRACPTNQPAGRPLGPAWEFVKAGEGAGYCIQKNRWGEDSFTDAANTCFALGGRLCSYNEWRYACQKRDTIGATFGDVSWEWVDEITGNDQALRATKRGSACHSDSNAGDYRGVDDIGTSRSFRCCVDR